MPKRVRDEGYEPTPSNDSKLVKLNPLALDEVVIVIVGTSAGYISNNMHPDALERWQGSVEKKNQALLKGTSLKKGAYLEGVMTPQQLFEESLRLDGEKRPCVSGGGVRKAMCQAAEELGLKGWQLRRVFQVVDDLLPILDSKPNMRRDKVGKNHLAYRAFFPGKWRVRVPVRYNKNRITMEQLVDILNAAGFSIGIGAWRPERGGSMGMFGVLAG